MTDRRAVGNLSIEELERILVMKRRAVRRDRLRRLAEAGRTVDDPPMDSGGGAETEISLHLVSGEARVLSEDSGRQSQEHETAEALQEADGSGDQPAKLRLPRVRDRALFGLEILALVGLVAILVGSLVNLKTLNEEVAQAREIVTPTATPLIQVSVLPGGSSPPSSGWIEAPGFGCQSCRLPQPGSPNEGWPAVARPVH